MQNEVRNQVRDRLLTWGINDVDLVVPPGAMRGCRLDRDALFPLQLHTVHLRPNPILAPHLASRTSAFH